MSAAARAAIVCAAAIAVAIAGCSSDVAVDTADVPYFESGPLCADDPLSCPSDEACWIDLEKAHYRCTKAGEGKAGDLCHNVAGQPSCAAGLTCYAVEGYEPVCTPLCDDAHACPGGAPCQTIEIASTSERIHACEPPSSGGAGGGGAGGGGGVQ